MTQPEPWLRGTLTEIPVVQRAVLHALEMAREDVDRFCGDLSDEELNARPAGLPSVAFHLKHIARSLDRLLTYAEGAALTEEQLASLHAELEPALSKSELFAELHASLSCSAARIRRFEVSTFDHLRTVGKKQLPTTVAGLLVHTADHTQRHVGQAVTTAKVLIAARQ